jgi:RND family efflux transporter MFP subunit
MMKRTLWILTAALAISGAGCGNSSVASGPGTPTSPAPKTPPSTLPPQPSTSPTAVKAADTGDILSVLSVEHQVDVSSERDGTVMSIARDEGASVKAGDLLAQLDDRSLQTELVKARSDLQVNQGNVKFKEAELKAKKAAYRRQQQLRSFGLSSEADLEAAEFEATGAEYDLHSLEALVGSAQAEIHRIEIQIDQTHIHAPFPGVVVHRYIRQGEAIAKGQKCFRVSQLGPLRVQFQVPESIGGRPERGAHVNLSLVEDPNRALSAQVVKVSPTVDPASDSYNVTAQLTGPGLIDLRPGMAVRVIWPGTSRPKP